MKIHNIEQGSDEWFEVRKGKMTASHAQAIGSAIKTTKTGKTTIGAGITTYILSLMSEVYSSAEKERYSNEHMDRGVELEDEAAEIYSLNSGDELEKVGFIEYNEFVGCSPDRLVKDKKEGVEIKCPSDEVYFKLLIDQKIDTKYLWQIMMCLLITGYKKWRYVVYNPNFKQDIIIIDVYPDEEKFEALRKGFDEGEKQIKLINERLK